MTTAICLGVVQVDLISPPKTQLILVDHNELGQAVLGAEESDIIECTIIIVWAVA